MDNILNFHIIFLAPVDNDFDDLDHTLDYTFSYFYTLLTNVFLQH